MIVNSGLMRLCFRVLANEHRAREERVPRELGYGADRQTILRIGADKRILHKKLATLCVGHHALFQRVELRLRKIFINVAPENFFFTAGLAHDRFVFRRASGVFAGIYQDHAMI